MHNRCEIVMKGMQENSRSVDLLTFISRWGLPCAIDMHSGWTERNDLTYVVSWSIYFLFDDNDSIDCLKYIRISGISILERGPIHIEATPGLSGPLFTKRTDVLPKDPVNCRSREIRVYTFLIALKFDRHLSSRASELPVKCRSNRIMITSNHAASRFGGKTSPAYK